MCQSVTCRVCGKTTWAGCGQHIAQVKRGVPASRWCGGTHTPDEIAAAKAARGSVWSRLLGRSRADA